jgi:hypothetical protein
MSFGAGGIEVLDFAFRRGLWMGIGLHSQFYFGACRAANLNHYIDGQGRAGSFARQLCLPMAV